MNFCSRIAIERREPMAGTAVRGEAYVFLPVPKQHWRSGELNTRWAARSELDAIRAVRKAGVITRLYDPGDAAVEAAPMLVHPGPRGRPEALDGFVALFAGRWPVDAAGSPRIAICTHGTRDRCCAKWGFAAWREAMRLHAEGLSPFAPLQTSHLGGDRFAATGIVFPSGSMYAHLDHADLAALLAAEAMGRITPEVYRGGVFEPQLAQVVRAGLARDGLINDTAVALQVGEADDRPDVAWAQAGAARYEVALASVEVAFYGSCEALEEGRGSRARRRAYASARVV